MTLENSRPYQRSLKDRERVFHALAKALKQEDDPRVQFVLIKGLEQSFNSYDEREVVEKILSEHPPHPDVFSRRFDEYSIWETFDSDGG